MFYFQLFLRFPPAPKTTTKPESGSTPEPSADSVKKYIDVFEINEERAQALYNSGYERLEYFKDAIIEDLVMVEKINSTVAKAIIRKIADLPQ